ncbi:protein DMP2 [Lathyrus oleraceus]|nr:protein DMP2-like [Pisum sativum]
MDVHSEHSEDDYYDLEDYDMDESHYFYVINAILSGTARLNILLPTVTTLAFSIFAPILTNDGECSILNRWLTGIFLFMLAVSCVFFTFTDSFKTATGREWQHLEGYGLFAVAGRNPACHQITGLLGLHYDVVKCYYPGMPRKVTNTLPLVVGFVVSILFVVFPSKRRGIGYPFLLQSDPMYSRH